MLRGALRHRHPSPCPSLPCLHLTSMDFASAWEVQPTDLLPVHPYAHTRRWQSLSTSALALNAPHESTFEDSQSHRQSIGSDPDSARPLVSFAAHPSEKGDISSPVSPSHGSPYVRHSSGITLILFRHKAGTSLPPYRSGSPITGMVVLSKAGGLASLDVKVRCPHLRLFL